MEFSLCKRYSNYIGMQSQSKREQIVDRNEKERKKTMKVLLVNGSPHENGCTYTALCEVAKALQGEGIETEIFQIGQEAYNGCLGCNACVKLGRCVFEDKVNEFTAMAAGADGFVFGSPVYFAGINGAMKCFMDRAFYSSSEVADNPFRYKVAAAVVSARRAGTTAALDQMNKYLTYEQMLIPASRYWNMVHGNTAEEVMQDEEGLQIMRVLGKNMAWLLKLKEAGEKAGVPLPEKEKKMRTNFIR